MEPTRISLFWAGVRAELPILLGVAPFGMIYGVLALDAGIPPAAAQAMSAIIFAGSSQLITTQMVEMLIPGLLIVMTIAIVNLRHALYSASIAPYIRHLSPMWKCGLAYFLTDEAYAVTIVHYDQEERTAYDHWFFLGAGITLWTAWQLSTAAGIFLGTAVPESWSLDFALALTFIALLFPTLKDRPSLAAAAVAGICSVFFFSLPYRLGLVAAVLAGILAGVWLEGRK